MRAHSNSLVYLAPDIIILLLLTAKFRQKAMASLGVISSRQQAAGTASEGQQWELPLEGVEIIYPITTEEKLFELEQHITNDSAEREKMVSSEL